jgi:hypothetical protein
MTGFAPGAYHDRDAWSHSGAPGPQPQRKAYAQAENDSGFRFALYGFVFECKESVLRMRRQFSKFLQRYSDVHPAEVERIENCFAHSWGVRQLHLQFPDARQTGSVDENSSSLLRSPSVLVIRQRV